jgi:hypothetical protein
MSPAELVTATVLLAMVSCAGPVVAKPEPGLVGVNSQSPVSCELGEEHMRARAGPKANLCVLNTQRDHRNQGVFPGAKVGLAELI